jgi:hypothetical protein
LGSRPFHRAPPNMKRPFKEQHHDHEQELAGLNAQVEEEQR